MTTNGKEENGHRKPQVPFIGTDEIIKLEELIDRGGVTSIYGGAIYRGTINNPIGLLAQRIIWGNRHLAKYFRIETDSAPDSDTKYFMDEEFCNQVRKAAHDYWGYYTKSILTGDAAHGQEIVDVALKYIQHDALSAGTVVAVKALKTPSADDIVGKSAKETQFELEQAEEFRKRFFREYHVMDSLRHPNIIRTIGMIDKTPLGDCIVMEYIEGEPLKKLIHPDAQFPPQVFSLERSLDLVIPLADALHYCHQRKIFHRDIKPGNILLTKEGTPKLFDFGICKDYGDASQTMVGSTLGTPSYMAPEQWDSHLTPVSSKTDVYALGMTLVEMLAGAPLYAGENIAVISKEVLDVNKPHAKRIPELIPACSPRYGALIEGMIQKDPKVRLDMEAVLTEAAAIRAEKAYVA
ncbi:MAG TPA: serine/threonine-protein kinase [Candidatus Binatia bacterium]|nr:serine/threonine-protein kinase [Candidatus Binatia bacterium]